jgi:hypothetical protein
MSFSVPDRQIDVLAIEVYVLQRCTDPQIEIWMSYREPAQTGNQPLAREVGGYSHGEHGRALQADQVLRCSQTFERIPNEGEVSLSGLRELEAAGLALE